MFAGKVADRNHGLDTKLSGTGARRLVPAMAVYDPFTLLGSHPPVGSPHTRNSIGVRTILLVCTLGFVGATAIQKLRDGLRPAPAALLIAPQAEPVLAASAPAGVALQAGRNGHFFVSVLLDGRTLPMMVDTGASACAFSEEDAARIGIRVGPADFTRVWNTANGRVRVAPIKIAVVQIGAITVRDVEAVVIPRGLLSTSLLGMSFLGRLREFGVAGSTMTLRG